MPITPCPAGPSRRRPRPGAWRNWCRPATWTRREEEILRLVFQDWSNEEILDKLVISRYTLLKHLQNLYRKCGVSSRWDLRKLGP